MRQNIGQRPLSMSKQLHPEKKAIDSIKTNKMYSNILDLDYRTA